MLLDASLEACQGKHHQQLEGTRELCALTFPRRVRSPVLTTTALPLPPTTVVPIHPMLAASVYSTATPAAVARMGSVSPVRDAKFMDKLEEAMMRASAGILSPVSRTMMSPRTRSTAGT